MLVHLGIERGLDGKLDQLLGEGAEIFFRFDVFGQLSGQCFEFVLVHLLTHEGILLKKLLIRGRLHNWIYRLELFSVTAAVCVSWLSTSQVTTASIHLAISPTCP